MKYFEIIKKTFTNKQKNAVKKLHIVCYFTICAFLLCMSCDNEQEAEFDGQYLKGTNWKLVGIFDTETGDLKTLKPQNCSDFLKEYRQQTSCYSYVNRCYTLSFDKENIITVYTCDNQFRFSYNIDYKTRSVQIGGYVVTLLHENFDDGFLFIETLENVQSFSFIKRQLRLYFNDKKNYLPFKSRS